MIITTIIASTWLVIAWKPTPPTDAPPRPTRQNTEVEHRGTAGEQRTRTQNTGGARECKKLDSRVSGRRMSRPTNTGSGTYSPKLVHKQERGPACGRAFQKENLISGAANKILPPRLSPFLLFLSTGGLMCKQGLEASNVDA